MISNPRYDILLAIERIQNSCQRQRIGLGIQRSQRERAGDCKCYEQIQEKVNDLTAICGEWSEEIFREAKVVLCCLGIF